MNFTYLLCWKELDRYYYYYYYYGVRYKKGCTTESIGTTYFSSSKIVDTFIKQNGLPTGTEIRKIFNTALEAKQWETKVLVRLNAANDPRWLNAANGNSFKNIVMDDKRRESISHALLAGQKNRPKRKVYNNGNIEIFVTITDNIPEGFVAGNLLTEKRRLHYLKLNMQTTEERKIAGQKTSLKTKGRKKPNGFGKKISIALTGKPKPWQRGEKNVAKRPEVRKKIGDKKRGVPIKPCTEKRKKFVSALFTGSFWVYNVDTLEVKKLCKGSVVLDGWKLGRKPKHG